MAGMGRPGATGSTISYGSGGGSEDYSNKIRMGIAKIGQHDPLTAQGMQAAYDSDQPYSSSFFGGMWNGLFNGAKSVGGGLIEGLGNITSAFAEPFRIEDEEEEDNFVVDFFEGLGGKENTYWSRNLASYGMEEGFARSAIGLTLDIFADPTTYIGAGGLGLAREAIAKGTKEIGEHGVRSILTKEAAERGGILIKDKFIRHEDQFIPGVYQEAKALLKGGAIHDDAVDALAGQAAHNADQKALGIVDEAINLEVSELGEVLASTIYRKRNLQALPPTYTSKTLGRTYTREELQKIYLSTQKLDRKQQIDLANKLFDGNPTIAQKERLGRTAAAAMGGLRLKFGLPFGEQLAKTFDSPFLAHRWQTNALSTRWKLGNKEFGVTDLGNFFRGTSGLVKLDTAIQQSVANGDGLWDLGAMNAFLHSEEGGYAGLKNYMYDKGLKGQKEWDRVFGRGITSIATPWSERAGKLTEGLTSGARAWRRDGYYGAMVYNYKRTAQVREKEFRQFASKYIEPWIGSSRQLGEDAAEKGQDWARQVYRDVIRYVEHGDEDALARIPEYMRKTAEGIRPTFRELHSHVTKQYGVKLGDMEEVFARNHHEAALKATRKKMKELDEQIKQIDITGADTVEGERLVAQLDEMISQRVQLEIDADDMFAQLQNMDAYDEMTELLGGAKLVSKAGPKGYFHHRWSDKFRSEMIGNLLAETKSYNKAKSKAAELERKMKTMDFEEAESYFKSQFPEAAEAAGGHILEDNVLKVMTRYVEDLSSAVLKTELERGGRYILNELGAIDTGAATRLTRNIVDPEWMPKAYQAALLGRLGTSGPTRERLNSWLDDFEERMGLVATSQPKEKTATHHYTRKEFIEKTVKEKEAAASSAQTVPGRWSQGPYGEASEEVPIEWLSKFREHLREPGAWYGGKVEGKFDMTTLEKAKAELLANGFNEPLILEYTPNAGKALLIEGNHRLAAAFALVADGHTQFSKLPVRMSISEGADRGIKTSFTDKAKTFNLAKEAMKGRSTDLRPSEVFSDISIRATASADVPAVVGDVHKAGEEAWGGRGTWRDSAYAGKHDEYVHIDEIERFKEFDFTVSAKERAKVDSLKDNIIVRGYETPVHVTYDPARGAMTITNGNHRLAAAKELIAEGHLEAQYIPVRLFRGEVGIGDRAFGDYGFKYVDETRVNTSVFEGKEPPWEARPSEFFKRGPEPKVAAKTPKAGPVTVKQTTPQGPRPVDGESLAMRHKREVIRALKDGEKVPTAVLRDYPDIMETLVKIPEKMKEPQVRALQTLFKELNQIKAQADGAVAIPEVAFKEVPIGTALGRWGRVDVPGLENFGMHPFMAAEFNKAWSGTVGKQMGGFRQNWRKFVMGPWKEWATLYWPGFHARNFMGAFFNNQLGGTQPYHYTEMLRVARVLRSGEEAVDKSGKLLYNMPYAPAKRMKIDGEVRDLTYGKVAEMMQDLGITGGNNWAMGDLRSYLSSREYLSLDAGHSISHKMGFTGKFQTDKWGEVTGAEILFRGWKEKGMSATTGVENLMRGAMFLKELEATGDTIAARASVMMRHGDYDELTDAENFIKDLLPFYKWMRTNLPFQMRQLIESPGAQLSTLDVQRTLVGEDERANMPEWMRQSLLVHLPWSKKINGVKGTEEVAAFMMMELPLHDVFMTGNEFASGFLPIVRQIGLENGLFKKSMFTGAPLEGTKTERVGYWGNVPGISHMLETTGIASRDAEGKLVTTDRWLNVLSTLPLYARMRNVLTDDPDREKLRVGAMVSMMAGMSVRQLGDQELNNVEADFFYSYVEPQVRKMQDMGYQFASIQDWAIATSSGGGGMGRPGG